MTGGDEVWCGGLTDGLMQDGLSCAEPWVGYGDMNG